MNNNKTYGIKADFAPKREDASRIIISYGLTKLGKDSYEWYEVYLYKKQHNNLSLADIKAAIIADINARTDERILNGFEWTVLHGDDAGKTVKVWLSTENQNNFKAKHDAAKDYPELVTFPMKYKIGEDENEVPVYENFADIQELAQFYLGGLAYIEQQYNAGWAEKDAIDWAPYEALFPANESE